MSMTPPLFTNPFIGMSTQELINKKRLYEKLLAEQSPDYIPPINTKTGKRGKATKMPWMIPLWEKGLSTVKALLNEEE